MPSDKFLSQWYWGRIASNFSEAYRSGDPNKSRKNETTLDVYPHSQPTLNKLSALRPINSTISEQIQWIAADVVN